MNYKKEKRRAIAMSRETKTNFMFISSELPVNDVNQAEVNIRSDQEILMRKIAAGILHMRLSANMALKSYSCGSICHRVSLQVVKCA